MRVTSEPAPTSTLSGVELQRGDVVESRVEDPGGALSGVYMVMALGGVFLRGGIQ